MNESTYRAIFGFVVIAYGAAISVIMAFRPERILAFYCRSRAWRWWYKFCFNMSAEDIVSAKMVRRTRIQGATALAFFTAIIFAALFQLGSHG
ncbi:hypothetical protein [Burkholderia cepacia]|uniref:hypothetical protein n=1 Tax=Burkholderia cepacia TaxID=292 RepID=UPI00177BE704|nr:hypothetical protein [Burkholderia cepacia]